MRPNISNRTDVKKGLSRKTIRAGSVSVFQNHTWASDRGHSPVELESEAKDWLTIIPLPIRITPKISRFQRSRHWFRSLLSLDLHDSQGRKYLWSKDHDIEIASTFLIFVSTFSSVF